MKTKLEVTLNQWKEIYNKEMAVSADLRNINRAVKAFEAILIIEKRIELSK